MRAGIIPVIHVVTSTHELPLAQQLYGFGINSSYRRLIDLAGHRETTDRTVIDNAIREFSEETLGVFGNVDRSLVARMPSLMNEETALYFVPFKVDPKEVHRNFQWRLANEARPEVLGLVWLTLDEIVSLPAPALYYKPHRLLSQNVDLLPTIDLEMQRFFTENPS